MTQDANRSFLNEEVCLVLNSLWMPVAWKTPQQAITSLCSEVGQTPPGYILDVTPDGVNRYTWDEWVELPLEARHLPLLANRRPIRCPTIVTMGGYGQMPTRGQGFSSKAIQRRDKGVCQVSGRKLKPGEGNLGHLKAKAKGGKRTFENIVWMDKQLNLIQGTRTVEEMGWTLLSTPKPPQPLPACADITPRLPDHEKFCIQ